MSWWGWARHTEALGLLKIRRIGFCKCSRYVQVFLGFSLFPWLICCSRAPEWCLHLQHCTLPFSNWCGKQKSTKGFLKHAVSSLCLWSTLLARKVCFGLISQPVCYDRTSAWCSNFVQDNVAFLNWCRTQKYVNECQSNGQMILLNFPWLFELFKWFTKWHHSSRSKI